MKKRNIRRSCCLSMSMSRQSHEKFLTFTDLLTPQRKAVSPVQTKFEYEKPCVIDAIVRAYNFTDPIPYKLYEFMDYFDTDDEQLEASYHLWTNWLSEIQDQHPQLPRMKVDVPYFRDDKHGPRYKPYICKCI